MRNRAFADRRPRSWCLLRWRFLGLAVLLGTATFGFAQDQSEECGNDYGLIPDPTSLRLILQAHSQWLADPDTGARAELCRMNLAGVELEAADLRRVKLEEADLRGAKLRGANLEKAHLHEANLAGADLTETNLTDTVMRKTNLDQADFSRADLAGASLRKSSASGARFVGANLSEANLTKVNFTRASLVGANLQGAKMRKAVLELADIRQANLDGAKLRQADFTRANLVGSSFVDADFGGAVLVGTNVDAAQLAAAQGLTEEQLEGIVQMSGNAFAALNAASEEASEPEVGVVGGADEPEVEAASVDEPEVEIASVDDSDVDEPEVAVASGTESEVEVASVGQPAEETEVAPAIVDGAYVVQLGSFRVEETAYNVWREVKAKHESLFAPYSARVVSVDLGVENGKWHRLQVGPLPSRQAAATLCANYQKARADAPCIPVTAGS